jgi:hypothetical protein
MTTPIPPLKNEKTTVGQKIKIQEPSWRHLHGDCPSTSDLICDVEVAQGAEHASDLVCSSAYSRRKVTHRWRPLNFVLWPRPNC